ncbi:TIGR02391 family protein [Mesorhizobium sp. M1273]|uniref:TIGR02391 family protein n=1 Tax=Mesorhizobium sp. M1273 TaxID=2957075 RepID=UPI0033383CF8
MSIALAAFERIARSSKNVGSPAVIESRGVHPFDERNIHPDIAGVSQKLFDDGHFAQATFEALKYVDNQVKDLTGIEDSGFNLMMAAFNEKNAKIMLTDLATISEKDEQLGFRHMFAGSMSAIRNPRAHDNSTDTIDVCLDHLSLASVLLRRLDDRIAP